MIKQFVPSSVRPLLRGSVNWVHEAAGRAAVSGPISWVRHAARRAAGQHPLIPPPALHSIGTGDFLSTGREFLGHFTKLGGLKPTDRVLDIGSGTGRMALPLVEYLTTGTYDGMDIVEKAIDWSNRTYRHRAGFRFHYSNIYNQRYNAEGTARATQYRFPFDDGSFDFVFLTSVFTHMMPDDIDHYLAEIRRVLAPGGTVLMTAFLINDPTRALIAERVAASRELIALDRSTFTFTHRFGRCYADIHAEPENATAYDEAEFRRMADAAGLEITAVHFGGWRGVPGVSFQDMIVAKPAS